MNDLKSKKLNFDDDNDFKLEDIDTENNYELQLQLGVNVLSSEIDQLTKQHSITMEDNISLELMNITLFIAGAAISCIFGCFVTHSTFPFPTFNDKSLKEFHKACEKQLKSEPSFVVFLLFAQLHT